ncbi:NADH-quinone oxidoreductase subunit C [uncultured Methylobacterium sp.]|uniref:NADH-quinone oxidoreductase subunit C n=1 Tax=uncultured Methylobacterium sp. TaxID=157278 RepID=UPI0035C9BD46
MSNGIAILGHTQPASGHAALQALADHIAAALGPAVVERTIVRDELTLVVQGSDIVYATTFLRDDPACAFRCFLDLCGADYPNRAQRFDVVYHLLSLRHNARIRVKVRTDETTPVPSVIDVFPGANWYEREAYDLYGILFSGHPDLRRLLTDYGFEGHPLRKDFPLTGFVEVRYDTDEARVVYEPVKLTQEFRNFDFLSPWEGTDYVLPGDEKTTA